MNNKISISEYSSECESGWTMYLDHLSNYSADHRNYDDAVTYCEDKNGAFEREEDDEDLSMVSDASSGPPHFLENNCGSYGGGGGGGGGDGGGVYSQFYGYYSPSFSEERQKNISKNNTKDTVVVRTKNNQNLCLDDTASSPVYDFTQDNVVPSHDFSQVYSSGNMEGEYSRTKKHFGFFKSSTKGKSGSFLGRKRQ